MYITRDLEGGYSGIWGNSHLQIPGISKMIFQNYYEIIPKHDEIIPKLNNKSYKFRLNRNINKFIFSFLSKCLSTISVTGDVRCLYIKILMNFQKFSVQSTMLLPRIR